METESFDWRRYHNNRKGTLARWIAQPETAAAAGNML